MIKSEKPKPKMSQQQAWSEKQKKLGLCVTCAKKVAPGHIYCLTHLIKRREHARKKKKYVRKYNCDSRRLEDEASK